MELSQNSTQVLVSLDIGCIFMSERYLYSCLALYGRFTRKDLYVHSARKFRNIVGEAGEGEFLLVP
jgi:hypothetical protein